MKIETELSLINWEFPQINEIISRFFCSVNCEFIMQS